MTALSLNCDPNLRVCRNILANEFEYDWIYMNVYPISLTAIEKKMTRFLDDIYKLKRCAISKRGPTWNEKVYDLISILDNSVDIKARDESAIESREEDLAVKEGIQERIHYEDNCLPDLPPGGKLSGRILSTKNGSLVVGVSPKR